MRKKIITNTIIFVSIILFVTIFKSLFGEGNTLVGVTIITTALTFMEKDLTAAPFKNFTKILTVNLFTLLFSFLAIQNIWIGILVNFLALFIIGYLFSYNLKRSLVVPFGLQYFFMLFYPAEGEVLFNRFLSLIFGSVFIMLIQFIFNKDKVFKAGSRILDNISDNILLKIKAIQEDKNFDEENIKIIELINSLKGIIFDKRVDDYYLTNDATISTDILWALERINILLDSINKLENKDRYKDLLNDVYNEVIIIKNRDFESSNIEILKNNIYNDEIDKTYINEFIDLINILIREVREINILSKKEKDYVKKDYDIPHHFHKITVLKRNFNIDSAKVRYSIKLGIVGAFTVFLAQYLNLSEGRWMSFTIFSLIQPYSEVSYTRVKDRIKATLIGGLIVLIAFGLVKNQTARSAIILLAGYLDPFTKNYRGKMICVTVSAVASAAIVGGTTQMVFNRVLFVIIGAILTLLANKYILPYKIKDMHKYLVEIYDSLINQMKEDISKEHNDYSIRNLYLITGFIEDKMKFSSNENDRMQIRELFNSKRKEVNELYNSYINFRDRSR
ncbi:FUSC family protein [Clostridium sp.]|jgi:Fusaric acid resistance protein-like|nr:FUSC family protein [Clostridium sp.]MDU3525265.1 FUSC family protein [Clostridium sp.]MDU4736353.1 FUSC family protein [Clostridium sp.]MDU6364306.1 FUSC family protein [Clostridium sp.]